LLNSSQPPILCNPLRLQSRGPSPTRGTPYPEVTVSICRVPSPEFSQAPEHIQLAHLCRFAVRSPCQLKLRGFSWEPGITHFRRAKPAFVITPQLSRADLPTQHAYTLEPGRPTPAALTFSVPHRIAGRCGNIDPLPISYDSRPRLRGRLTCADARGAGNLGLRRQGLSPCLSLLMSAFALPIPPAGFTPHLHRPTERSPTIQEPEFRGQKSETARHPRLFPTPGDALQHLGIRNQKSDDSDSDGD